MLKALFYAGAVFLTYLETLGFEKNSKMLMIVPILVLIGMTIKSKMEERIRNVTIIVFVLSAASMYTQSNHRTTVPLPAVLQSLSNILYFYTYKNLTNLKFYKTKSSIVWTIVSFLGFLIILQDLIVAIPFLSLIIFLHFSSHLLLITSFAGTSRRAKNLRALANFAGFFATFLFVFNSFHTHSMSIHKISRFSFYFANFFMFLANERDF